NPHAPLPPTSLSSTSSTAIDQLLDLFVRGADGTYNPAANYDYLSYLFADLAKHPSGRAYFLTPAARTHDGVVPLCKLTVFTSHASDVRRKGVANTLKNAAFETAAHSAFLSEDEINVLPYLLLPLAGNEEYDEAEMLDMLPELQLLPVDKRRDADHGVLRTHVETLTLLATTRGGRERLREVRVYPVIRETHLRVEDEGVREACDRLVQVLMRDEEGEGLEEVDHGMTTLSSNSRRIADTPQNGGGAGSWARGQVEEEEEEEDDDDKIVEV
ncbi:Protein HGH1-like, partial [Lachnellula arida]